MTDKQAFEAWFAENFEPHDRATTYGHVVVEDAWNAALAWLRSQGEPVAFQARVEPWLLACFGDEIANDRVERNHRFLEEALELVQSLGCTATEARQLVEYVYGRPIGEPHQEVGGVMVTLSALCRASGLDMHEAGETELARIWTKVEQIRAKQAAKPKHSPLPQAAGPTASIAPQPAIPDGWRLVPVEPTQEMLRSAFCEAGGSYENKEGIYSAMLAASPQCNQGA